MEIASVEENNISTQTPDSFVSSMPSIAVVEMCSVCMVGPADQNEKEEEELGKKMPCKFSCLS
ncbi:hypothetical protein MKW92_008369 [Papaver armeniacum]|nr:hypothetical protein MKW92_008369 [Papaver armeniacum]